MPEATAPLISVIIVSYNTRAMTLDCLQALHPELEGLRAEVWVVDNASADGSVEAIRERFPSVRVIANEHNVGFGAANNQAMAQARGDFLLLLNSDAFPRPGAIAALLEQARAQPRVAVAGPRLLNADGSLQRSCWRFPSPARTWMDALYLPALWPSQPALDDYRHWPHDAPRAVDYVIGACMLVRREVYEAVGGFDERFFLYGEEADWQRRMSRAGFEVWFIPGPEVVHLGGASGETQRAQVRRLFFESQDLYCRKHHGLAGLALMRLGMAVNNLLRAPAWAAIACAGGSKRGWALAKLRLSLWLAGRSLFHWRLGRAGAAR